MGRILAIDDEEGILTIIEAALEKEGHSVTKVSDPGSFPKDKYKNYDLILLDVMMPGIDGFTLCREIRGIVDSPIIFLTAKTMEKDLIMGLSLGGDDYITKPFKIGELRARVGAHLRREKREKQNAFSISGLSFNLLAKVVCCGEQIIPLTKSEYEICEFLALNHGQVFSRGKIYESVFGFDGESDDTVIVEHIKNIRSRLGKMGVCPIETIWGIGYKWKS